MREMYGKQFGAVPGEKGKKDRSQQLVEPMTRGKLSCRGACKAGRM